MRFSLIVTAGLLAVTGCQMQQHESPATAPIAQAVVPATQPKAAASFGAAQRLTDAQNVPVEKVLADPAQYTGKYVRITGIVSAVCPQKGCWLRMTPEPGAGEGNVFVKFVDPPEGRLVPMEAVGHDVIVEGIVKSGSMSEAQARHLKQDAGASQQEIDKIVGPQKQVMIGSPAATIEGVTKEAS